MGDQHPPDQTQMAAGHTDPGHLMPLSFSPPPDSPSHRREAGSQSQLIPLWSGQALQGGVSLWTEPEPLQEGPCPWQWWALWGQESLGWEEGTFSYKPQPPSQRAFLPCHCGSLERGCEQTAT
ncbi:hypothetical protein mRhiFer1_010202 [Rhinolophus ferrumequinum]|uniref:Uncharacterized protein n=1 Tax=Rhinolophus ferrumequinum TaxID=59479 RepID=A0A7J7X578_RHIFE|nr:hypothetical protein mRhiFer1_010202 [Rhinolophus ferrumequinum]